MDESFDTTQDKQQENPTEPIQNPSFLETSPKKNFTPKFIAVIIGLLVLGGIAYGGIWYWQKQQDSSLVIPTYTPRPDPTAGWQTYRNEEYGFEVKYPGDWEATEGSSLLKLEKRFSSTTNTNPAVIDDFCKLEFHVFDDKNELETIQQYLDRLALDSGNPLPENLTPLIIDSRPSVQSIDEELGRVKSVFVPLSETEIVSASIICGSDVVESGESGFDQILSTFRFLE